MRTASVGGELENKGGSCADDGANSDAPECDREEREHSENVLWTNRHILHVWYECTNMSLELKLQYVDVQHEDILELALIIGSGVEFLFHWGLNSLQEFKFIGYAYEIVGHLFLIG